MDNIKITIFLLLMCSVHLKGQVYDDYLGNGHTVGMKVSSSSDVTGDSSIYSITGSNIIPDLIGASRFLSQTTLGANYEEIEHVSQVGVHAWLDDQMAMPYTTYSEKWQDVYDTILHKMNQVPGIQVDSSRRSAYLDYTFHQKLFTEDDMLRQRVALALSQIYVITLNNSVFNQRSHVSSSYYDVLYEGAFGNFRDLLYNITFHPAMGLYLSHFNNKKADPDAGTFPDENYAREIMQLFSVGLFMLNNDGTFELDEFAKPQPTYDITDVQELSKIFTGFSGGAWDLERNPSKANVPLRFGKNFAQYDLTVPMILYDDEHEQGKKVMFTGDTIPAGQTAIEDVDMALDIIFNHQNVGPFIAIRLIQHLVKSNPSPAYVNRVATAFNDNGAGVRGDLSAVIRAIFVDPEAIECAAATDTLTGKLIQPMERFTNLFKAFNISSPSGHLWWKSVNQLRPKVEQAFLASPTVFNFFTPFYAEDKFIAPKDKVSPEFQILHSTSGIHYINLIDNAIKNKPFNNQTLVNAAGKLTTNPNDVPYLDASDEIAIYENDGVMAMLDRLDLVLCRGQLSQEVKDIIAYTISEYETRIGSYNSTRAVQDATYFIMASPNFMIKK